MLIKDQKQFEQQVFSCALPPLNDFHLLGSWTLVFLTLYGALQVLNSEFLWVVEFYREG